MNIKSILLTTVLAFASLGMTACDESRGNDFQGEQGPSGEKGDDGQSFDEETFCVDNPDNIICTENTEDFCAIPENADRFVCDDDISEFCGREENAERPICVGVPGDPGEDFDFEQFCIDNPENPICDDRDAFCAENPSNLICFEDTDSFCEFTDAEGNKPNADRAICQVPEEPEEPETGGLIFNVQQTTSGLLTDTLLEPVNDGLNFLLDPEAGILSPLTGPLDDISNDGGPLAPVRDGVNTLIVQPDSLRVVIDSLNQILQVLDPSALGGGGLPELPGVPGEGGFEFPFDTSAACVFPVLGPIFVENTGGSCD